MPPRAIVAALVAGVAASTSASGPAATTRCPERAAFASDEPENAAPAWSPDGRSIAFESNRTGRTQIYVMRVRTCGVRRVTEIEGFWPDWSPDGRRLVFSRFAIGAESLWTVGVDGRGLRRVTNPSHAADSFASWSRRGNLIAFDRSDFAREEVELREIWTVRPDGSRLRRLVRGGWNLTPAWSPDGRWIAWSRSSGGRTRIWRMRSDGSRRAQITPGFSNGDTDPSWSPDGRRIVYSGSTATGGLTIWVKPAVGGRPRNVVGRANAGDPDWSPDGRWIVFARHAGDATHVYLVRPDGTGMRPLAVAG